MLCLPQKVASDKPDSGKVQKRASELSLHKACSFDVSLLAVSKEKESQTQNTPVGLINYEQSKILIEEPVLLPKEIHELSKLL